jgi:hypothetical protein
MRIDSDLEVAKNLLGAIRHPKYLCWTHEDADDYSHLRLGLRRDCLVEFHRTFGQFPVASPHIVLPSHSMYSFTGVSK